jgi:hypothetical protein
MRIVLATVVLLGLWTALASAGNERAPHEPLPVSGSPLPARGAFSCDFEVDLGMVAEPPAAELERDRILSQRFAKEVIPFGKMLQKHLPLLPLDEAGTRILSGGRYLFTSRLQAAKYAKFITEKYHYPAGVQFLDRPSFSQAECRDWRVIWAWRFDDLEEHVALRTERFDTNRTTLREEVRLGRQLRQEGIALLRTAEAAGYAEVHILHNILDHKIQIVYFQGRLIEENPDFAALEHISTSPPLADPLLKLGLDRVFDVSEFVLTIWKQYGSNDSGAPSLFPNSPPFPEPFCGDGLCVPSRGEDGASCSHDCTPLCGDGVCDADEILDTCPTDCEIPVS